MDQPDYWARWGKRRLSRRRLLAGAAGLGAGLAALSVAGCGGGGEEGPRPSPGASPAASPGGSPAATPTGGLPGNVYHRWGVGPPPPLEAATTRGGTYRYFGYDAMTLDTFDPHQTQYGPTGHIHSAIFSRVLEYWDSYHGVMEPDLAESMPETPDHLTYVLKIRSGVRFHNTDKIRQQFPQVAGRELTAEDVKYSIERQMNRQSPRSGLYYRMSQWETIDKIELVDPLTLRITTRRPTAPFPHYLADTHNFIIAKELVDPAKDDMNSLDKMIGTGPFILDKFAALQAVRVVRNPDWFAKNDLADKGLADRPLVDGFESIWLPADNTAIEIAFDSKQVEDTVYVDNISPGRIAADTGSLVDEWLSSSCISTRLLVADSPAAKSPFKDLRLRQALNIAIDRSRMGQQIYQNYFQLGSPVSQAFSDWALPLEELSKRPGYRFKREEREQDLVDAKQMWEAGGGSSIGSVEVMYTAIPDFVKAYYPQFERGLKEALDFDVKGRLDPTGYTEITQGLLQKRLAMTFGYDNGWLEPDDYLYPYFHSTGPKNSFNLSDPTLDGMLGGQREEFDRERRIELVHDIQRYLLNNVVARLDWVSEIERGTRWPYSKNQQYNPWFGDNFLKADLWLDSNDPAYQGRPT
jgi:peptide/nickel transport system substrate-binding protein